MSADVLGVCDDDLSDAPMDGVEGVLYLRYHTAGDDAVADESGSLFLRDERDDTAVVVGIAEHSGLFEAEGERGVVVLGEGDGHGRGDGAVAEGAEGWVCR